MARVVGALRVAHLIGGEILVTDSMLLDSRFFTTVGPRDLATLLGSPPGDLPLTVLVNGPTVGDALEDKLARGQGFRWQLAGQHQREGWVTPEIRSAWDEWVRAAERGAIRTEPMLTHLDGRPKGPFEIDVDLSSDHESEHVEALLAAAGRRDRSGVYAAYAAAVADDAAPQELTELKRLRAEHDGAYFTAMARQHDADWVTFATTAATATHAPGRTALSVSGQLLELAVEAPPAVFAHLLHATREERAKLQASPSRHRLRALAFCADAATRTASIYAETIRVARALFLAFVAVVLAVPPVRAAVGRLAWLAFGIAALLAMPWDTIKSAWDLRPSALDGKLSVGGHDRLPTRLEPDEPRSARRGGRREPW